MDSNDIMELLKSAQAKYNVPSNPESSAPSDDENQYQSILEMQKDAQSNDDDPDSPGEEQIPDGIQEMQKDAQSNDDDPDSPGEEQIPDGILEMQKDAQSNDDDPDSPGEEQILDGILEILKNAQSRDDSSAPQERKKPSEKVLKILNISHSTESKTTPEEANSTSISASASLPFEQVISYIPVNDDLLYVSKIYNLFNKLRENPGNDKVAAEVSREIETRCNEILQLIDRYRYDDCPPDMKDLSDEIADAVEKYFDGMCYFKEYIADRDEELVLNALELVFLGDQLVNEIQFKINRHIAENPVTTWL